MKFKKTKRITALVLSAVMASSMAVTSVTALAAETTTTKAVAANSDNEETGMIWVVDQEAYDEKVITGYTEWYECTGCGEKFYFKDYPEENGDGGQGAASDAVSNHLFECSADTAGYTLKKEPVYETIHHYEQGHYERIAIDRSSVTIEEGQSYYIGAIVDPNPASTVKWTSSDPSIASVTPFRNAEAFIEGVKEGTATITATSVNGAYVTCKVTVKAPHVHSYGTPTYNWSDDYSKCTATFKCTDGDDTQTVDCTVTSETKDATCNSVGQTIYTATVTMGDETYTDIKTVTIDKNDNHQWDDGVVTTPATCTEAGVKTYTCTECGLIKTEAIPAIGHSYSVPTFNWSDDCKTCTATISCENGDDTQTLDCDVAVKNNAATCTEDGSDVYTATVTFNGKEYSDSKTVAIEAMGHTYGEPTFKWSDDRSSCTATFTCTSCDDTKTVDATVDNLGGGMVINYLATATFNDKTYTDTATKVRFVDVPKDEYYYDAVDWAAGNGITSGVTPTKFSPNGTCTRAQMVTFLWNVAGKPEPKDTSLKFSDVKSSDWYYKAVLWAAENDITAGTSATKFSPNAACTRAQVVKFLWNVAGKPEPTGTTPSFTDVKTSDWYYGAVQWAAENKVTAGTGNHKFSPNHACKRADIVTLLYNYLGKK